MKTLKEIIDSGSVNDIKIDPTLNERLGPGPLFPHQIERVKALLKGTKFDKSANNQTSTPA